MLKIAAREYLKNLIAYNLTMRLENNSIVMGHIENEILDFLNGYQFNRKEKVTSVQNYLKELRETLEICQETYMSILQNGTAHPKMFDFPSDVDNIEWFSKMMKEMLKNNAQFNIIIDDQNRVVFMKIATEPENWSTYRDLSGVFVENIHDYSIVELDDSYKSALDRRSKN